MRRSFSLFQLIKKDIQNSEYANPYRNNGSGNKNYQRALRQERREKQTISVFCIPYGLWIILDEIESDQVSKSTSTGKTGCRGLYYIMLRMQSSEYRI